MTLNGYRAALREGRDDNRPFIDTSREIEEDAIWESVNNDDMINEELARISFDKIEAYCDELRERIAKNVLAAESVEALTLVFNDIRMLYSIAGHIEDYREANS